MATKKTRAFISISQQAYDALASYVKRKEKQGLPCNLTGEASAIILEATKNG